MVRRREEVPLQTLTPGVSVAEMLNDEHGCLGLHQRRLRLADTAALAGPTALAGGGLRVVEVRTDRSDGAKLRAAISQACAAALAGQ